MATQTITGKIIRPDGGVPRNGYITATLSQGTVLTGTGELPQASVLVVASAVDGTFTLKLYSNADMTPTGTFYAIVEVADDATYKYNISVPNVGGPFAISNIQTGTPTASPSPSHLSTLTVDAEATVGDLKVVGLTGALAGSRYVGATASGAPVSGTFSVGDWVIDRTGKIFICTTAGTPGTWTQVGGAASFASANDHFLTTVVDADLTNNTVIPGLASSPDIRVAGANDNEFDAALAGNYSTFGGFVTANANTTFKSMFYIKKNTSGGGDLLAGALTIGLPATPFTLTCKMSALNGYANTYRGGMFVCDTASGPLTGGAKAIGIEMLLNNFPWSVSMVNYTGGSGAGGGGAPVSSGIPAPFYFKMVVHAANNVDALGSFDGYVFFPIVTGSSFLASLGCVGVYVNSNQAGGASPLEACFDWIRFS